ncbi:MAG: helix-turn-helix domain-containing protein [Firmicutes bacterium]|nr:helix-turn-helix domain-containing protein [Bacillota bacterium]
MVSRFLTAEQAADLLQTDTGTLRRLAREGRIPATKIGRQWRFDEDLLREWVRERSLSSLAQSSPTRASAAARSSRRGKAK